MTNKAIKDTLIKKVNESFWWHVTPADPFAYKKRGKFLASTFRHAEFYGRPNDVPERVAIRNPIFGFTEIQILRSLFPDNYKKLSANVVKESPSWYKRRISLDSKMYKMAKKLGYDAIILLGSTGLKSLQNNRKPNSIELNVLNT